MTPDQPIAVRPADPMEILASAVAKDATPDTLERLSVLAEKWLDRDAAKEFADSMAKFQASCPPIPKTKKADRYSYAPLDVIVVHIGPHLHPNGLSFGWDTEIRETGIDLICTVRHINGHSVQSHCFMEVGKPERGLMKAQMIGSAMTYGQRYSLIQALGLTTCQSDDDGASSGQQRKPREEASNVKPASKAQVTKIMAMCRERGIEDKARKARMFALWGKDSTKDLTQHEASAFIEKLAVVPPKEV